MSFEYDAVRGILLFLAGLAVAAVGLRLLFKWRHATMLARARRACARLKAPATTLSAVEERAAAVEELIEFPDSRAAAAAVREVLGEHDDTIRSAAIEVLRQTRALDRWRRDLRRGTFKAKLRAIEALGEVGDERAIEELLEALGDDDPDIAHAASRAVSARDVDYACERLADALASPSRRLAETAAAALVHMGEGSVEYLVSRLASLNPQARRLAAESLGSIGGEKLKDVLLPLLTIDPDPEVRAVVAAALARVDGGSAVADIQHLARYDPDWFVRARAYSLLAEMGADGATQHLLDGLAEFEPGLAQLAENGHNVESYLHGSRRVRRAIVAGLRLLGLSDDEIAAAERGAETGSLSGEESQEASNAAGMMRLLDSAQRMEGARRLSEIGPAAAEPLTAALQDPDPVVRTEAARALGRIGSRDFIEALADCLRDPDPNVRLAAATAVRAVVTREAAKELTE